MMVSENQNDTIKLICVASMPRSGSMWAYNVSRSILRRAGKNVFPQDVPQSDDDMERLSIQGLQDGDPKNIWTLKTHRLVPQSLPKCRFITTVRDPRDALVSYKRFMHCDFEKALEAASASADIADYYREFPSGICLSLDYRDLSTKPDEVVGSIAAHIGCRITPECAAEIASEFSRDTVKQRIRNAESNLDDRLTSGAPISPEEIVHVSPTVKRVFELNSGFQSDHVSDYQEGEWKKILTTEEQQLMHAELGAWLQKNGY